MDIYVVKDGDTVYSIAKELGISVERLIRDNGIDDTQNLQVGRALVILRPYAVHSVKSGDNLLEIALNNNTSLNAIFRNNPWLGGRQEITSDDILTLVYGGDRLGKLSTNACAYPDINKDVLSMTLPYLTYLTIMGYGVNESGGLMPLDDSETVELARYYGTTPIMHINMRNNRILGDGLLSEIENYIIGKRFDGVNIDFGDISLDEEFACDEFFGKLKNICNRRGKVAFTTSYCNSSQNDISELSDGIILMPENMLGLPCLDYKSKVNNSYLPVRGYGVDLCVGDDGTYTKPTILSNLATLTLAGDTDSLILYDDSSNQAYFEYTDGENKHHKVLLDDPISIYSTLKRACDRGNSGITVWNIDKFCPYVWSVINSTVNIIRTGDKDSENRHFPMT